MWGKGKPPKDSGGGGAGQEDLLVDGLLTHERFRDPAPFG